MFIKSNWKSSVYWAKKNHVSLVQVKSTSKLEASYRVTLINKWVRTWEQKSEPANTLVSFMSCFLLLLWASTFGAAFLFYIFSNSTWETPVSCNRKFKTKFSKKILLEVGGKNTFCALQIFRVFWVVRKTETFIFSCFFPQVENGWKTKGLRAETAIVSRSEQLIFGLGPNNP